ncbi:MAG: hypothetical protein Q9160_006797 [Pyrenula sp. 1 TL-2023]
MLFSYLIAFCIYVIGAFAASGDDWRNRIIYQVLTDRFARSDGSTTYPCNTGDLKYCGGSWKGITNQLNYIQAMGFTAVWISPITLNIDNPASYHGYWQSDINSLNTKFGTAADLRALSSALHSRGMYLMVDIVVNHYGWTGSQGSVNYAGYKPFNSVDYFHPFCQITQDDYDAGDQEAIEQCWLGNNVVELPDVNTTHPKVISTYNKWITTLVSRYGIDGLRIDSVKCTQQSFFPNFVSASGVYNMGEVADGNPDYVCPYTNYVPGVINYPLYYPLVAAFQSTSGDMQRLVAMINQLKSSCKDTTLMAPFLENHDQPRFPSYTSDRSLIRNALLTTLMSDGVPSIYQGQEWALASPTDPSNREAIWLQSGGFSGTGVMHGFIAQVNAVRNWMIAVGGSGWTTYQSEVAWSDNNSMAMRKGSNGYQSLTIVTNKGGSGAKQVVQLSAGWGGNDTIYEVLACGDGTTQSDGSFFATIEGGVGQIWVRKAILGGSGICGM